MFNGGLRLGIITNALHHVQLLLVAEIESLKSNFQYQPLNIKSEKKLKKKKIVSGMRGMVLGVLHWILIRSMCSSKPNYKKSESSCP